MCLKGFAGISVEMNNVIGPGFGAKTGGKKNT